MKQCHICGTANSNNASFCASCGSALGGDSYESVTYPAYSGNSTLTSEEREVIEGMKRNFRREKKSFKIISIIGIVCLSIYACFVLLFAVLFILAGNLGTWSTSSSLNLANLSSVDPGTAGTYVVSLAMIIYCIVYLVMLLPGFIVGLVAAKKIDYYLTTIDNDIEPSRKRATAVGMIVFSAIFNNIAMIFVILNFVYARRNAKVIESIINKQHLQNPHLG
ncbi:MAG: hypothetical protein IJS71_02725 [Clostridia bacterium]|nr:hypothetical protein [Clostridia bacterium]